MFGFDKCTSCVPIIVKLLQLNQSATFPLDLYNPECTYRAGSCHLSKFLHFNNIPQRICVSSCLLWSWSPAPVFLRSASDSPPFCIQYEPPDLIPFKTDYLSSLLFRFYLWSPLVLSFCSCRFLECVTEFSARTLSKLGDVEKSGRTPLRTWWSKQCTEGTHIAFVHVHCFKANRVLKANSVKH
jgi:hypothetical protein